MPPSENVISGMKILECNNIILFPVFTQCVLNKYSLNKTIPLFETY